MKHILKFWYLPLIIGILHIVLGVWVLLTPMTSFLALTVILSAGIAITGLLELIYAISNRESLHSWGWYLFGGVLNLVIGVYLVFNPRISLLMLSIFIGLWILFRSIIAIVNAFDARKWREKQWVWMLGMGVVGVLFSIMLIWKPAITGVTIGLWMGIGIVTLGIFHILIGVVLRRMKKFQDHLNETDGDLLM